MTIPASQRRPLVLRALAVALTAGMAAAVVAGCGPAQRSAEGPLDLLGPAQLAAAGEPAEPLTPDSAAPPALAATTRLGLGRGVDLCIFNQLATPITVRFAKSPGIQGDPDVNPGAWVCGYDYSDAYVEGTITGLPEESLLFSAENPGWGWPDQDLNVMRDDIRFCGLSNSFKEGESDMFDDGRVRYEFGRNGDDNDWKYLYLYLKPSQGATAECIKS